MPGITDSPTSEARLDLSPRSSGAFRNELTIDDNEYPALDFPSYAENPLSKQLGPIAVVGMGCRLPGDISSSADFWEMMMNKGTGQTSKVPASRFNIDAHYHTDNDRPGSFGILGGYFLNESLREFDPSFFEISPIEAIWMDPQQKKLLEVVYEAFESGGVKLSQVSGSKTACFVGSFTSDFQQISIKEPSFRHSYAATGADPGIISNRISHVFNLKGPSMLVNTACSSSVYAIHNACNALRNDECDGAVVGGTNLILTVDQHMNTAKLGVLSPTSTCHTFDAAADGYGRAEGIGAVYLKRLSDAVRDGDPVRGIIRSSAVNSNGKAPGAGITNPNMSGQAEAIRHAYSRGGNLDPRLTGYFECHGTGTALGDPVEVNAVSQAMNEQRSVDGEPLLIGAVKTNIGHSEAASGLSALIKAILIVEKGIIPATRGIMNLNPKIDWHKWKVRVPTEAVLFPSDLPVKRVSVNSFGYGGTNAHIIVESADSLLPREQTYVTSTSATKTRHLLQDGQRPFLLPFSAHNKNALKRNIIVHAGLDEKYNLHDLSYTLANRRSSLPCRAFTVASHGSLKEACANDALGFTFADKKKCPTIGFVFTGQGAQWSGMGQRLMAYYPSFLQSINLLDRTLCNLPNGPVWSLQHMLQDESRRSWIEEAEFAQPLCTAIQIALVRLLHSWDIKPAIVVGHSSGEIGAAYAAGLISASEAIIAAYCRGKAVSQVETNGAMMAVGLGTQEVQDFIVGNEGKVVIACHNSPTSVTLSGDLDALANVKQRLDQEEIFAKLLKTGGKAYHSHYMEAAARPYKDLLRDAKNAKHSDALLQTSTTMMSTVYDSVVSGRSAITNDYWINNLLSPVLFNEALHRIKTAAEFSQVDLFIEIGPHCALKGPLRQIFTSMGLEKCTYIPTLIRGEQCADRILNLAGELFIRNYPLNMERVTAVEELLPSGRISLNRGALLVDLPRYQWDTTKEWWAEGRASKETRTLMHARHDVLGNLISGASIAEPQWRNVLRLRDIPWLKDHSLGGEAVFPAAAYFSMAIEAVTQLNERRSAPLEIEGYILRDVTFKSALVTPDNETGIEIIYNMRPSKISGNDNETKWWDFTVTSIVGTSQHEDHVSGSISINAFSRRPLPRAVPNFRQRTSGKSWNQKLKEVGFDYGPVFQDMQNIRSDGRSHAVACETTVKSTSETMQQESRHVLHPGTVDSVLQLQIVSIFAGRLADVNWGAVPTHVDEVSIWLPSSDQLQNRRGNAYAWLDHRGSRSFCGGSQLVSYDGELLMDVSNLQFTTYEAAAPLKAEKSVSAEPFWETLWNYDFDYLKSSKNLSHVTAMDLVSLATHKNPQIKVVDFGLCNTLDILSKHHALNYTVMEASDIGFEQSSLKFKDCRDEKIEEFEIAASATATTSLEGSFDLVLLPLSSSCSLTLGMARRLLTPNGIAIVDMKITPSIAAFVNAGFSEPDIEIVSADSHLFVLRTLRDLATQNSLDAPQNEATIVYRKELNNIGSMIETAFKRACWQISTVSLAAFQCKTGAKVIMLADLEGPLLADPEVPELSALQKMTQAASCILWVTPGGLLSAKRPEYALASGLARSVRSENCALNFTTLDFDFDNTSPDQASEIVLLTAQRQVSGAESHENEYCVSYGQIYIGRILPNETANSEYVPHVAEVDLASLKPSLNVIGKVRSGKVFFEMEETLEQTLPADHVEVRVSVSGLCKEDTLALTGSEYYSNLSHEIGGVVTRIGHEVNNISIGQEVFGFSFDKLALRRSVSSKFIRRLGPGDILSELAALPMAYGPAIYGLQTLARLDQNEILLILNGTGSSGAAAIRVAQYLHAVPYVVANNVEQAKEMEIFFDLPEAQIICCADEPISSKLRLATGGRDADVIFGSGFADASVSRECWRAIAPLGRFVEATGSKVAGRSILDSLPFQRGASYLPFDLETFYSRKPDILGKLLDQILSLYRRRLIAPLSPINIRPLADFDTAASSFSSRLTFGKTLISYQASAQPIKVLSSRQVAKFRSDATYMLVGCLGGLGQSLTSWMVERGARHFVFISRSGTDAESAATLVNKLEAEGVGCLVVRGDVTVKGDVERAVNSVPLERPIRGVVQAAMVLKDGIFHNMTHSNWLACTGPKVQGTLNLHNALQEFDLDFFVMTSSTSGILGTPGQTNYAASNAFLDSFARYRASKSQPACALILPMVLGVGYVAEHPEIEESLKRKGIYGIDEEHLLESLEASITVQRCKQSTDHIIAGLDPSKLQVSMCSEATTDGSWINDARFGRVLHTIKSTTPNSGATGKQSILATIVSTATPAEAVSAATSYVIEKLSRLMLVPLEDIEPERTIADYGVDSMIGAELRNWIFRELSLDLPFNQLLSPSLSITKFAERVCENQGISLA